MLGSQHSRCRTEGTILHWLLFHSRNMSFKINYLFYNSLKLTKSNLSNFRRYSGCSRLSTSLYFGSNKLPVPDFCLWLHSVIHFMPSLMTRAHDPQYMLNVYIYTPFITKLFKLVLIAGRSYLDDSICPYSASSLLVLLFALKGSIDDADYFY